MIFIGIGAICGALAYFLLDFSWWSALILGFIVIPLALIMVASILSLPIIGIGALIEKIKERRHKEYD